jgi:hypothetical protein
MLGSRHLEMNRTDCSVSSANKHTCHPQNTSRVLGLEITLAVSLRAALHLSNSCCITFLQRS